MAKQTITLELDAETLRRLAALGDPGEVLARLAESVVSLAEHQQTPADEADEDGQGPWPSLSADRSHADMVLSDQREANEQMVLATLRAHEIAEEAAAAKERAEENARTLQSMAEFRELFIGMLGHDLRNPLASIAMSAGMLLYRGRLNEQDTHTASQIVRVTQRMARMIIQLLDLTRVRLGGGMPITVEAIDLAATCRHVVEEFGPGVRMETEGDLTGTWDPDRLSEALSNLLGNARDYATPGTPVVVRLSAEDEHVVVAVSNDGDPIHPDVLPYIFEPFRRGRSHARSQDHGLGLGLYIAHQIVLSHTGTLEVRSADGTTTFAMRLPRSVPAPASSRR